MTQNPPNINILWAELVVGELVRQGVTMFCISPGSRSAPLTVAAAANRRVKTVVALDERGAAFYALGYARAGGRPAALICTSGTAPANYYPAVIEAFQSRLPLIVLSADRPPELRDTGANQTIAQVGLFGPYTNWAIDLPAPDAAINPRYILTSVDQAFFRATGPPAGPVQINCMFREPLEPVAVPYPDDYLEALGNWRRHSDPRTRYAGSRQVADKTDLQEIAAQLNSDPKTLLVVGRTGDPDALRPVLALAGQAGWPVFADIAAGLPVTDRKINRILWYDLLLAAQRFKRLLQDYRIIHIGDPLTSKRFLQFAAGNPARTYIHVHDHPRRQDPAHLVTKRITAGIPDFCTGLKPLVHRFEADEQIIKMDRTAGAQFRRFVEQEKDLSEIGIAAQVAALIPAGHGLFLGSSMPVRDFDMFGRVQNNPVTVGANRGASGIDGSISSASGFAAGLAAPVTAVIGDLAFLHDLNALDLLRKTEQPIILVVINNNGGGIFSFLPISGYESVFETYFAAPHHLQFAQAAGMFGLEYSAVPDIQSFAETYLTALGAQRHHIIEVPTDRTGNYRQHRRFLDLIVTEIDQRTK